MTDYQDAESWLNLHMTLVAWLRVQNIQNNIEDWSVSNKLFLFQLQSCMTNVNFIEAVANLNALKTLNFVIYPPRVLSHAADL